MEKGGPPPAIFFLKDFFFKSSIYYEIGSADPLGFKLVRSVVVGVGVVGVGVVAVSEVAFSSLFVGEEERTLITTAPADTGGVLLPSCSSSSSLMVESAVISE